MQLVEVGKDEFSATVGKQRRAAVRAIKRAVEPHFRDSGYVTTIDPTKPRFAEGNRRPVRLWAPQGNAPISLRGAFVLTDFIAITEFGPMTDAHGGGMTWESYSSFPVEDLLKLRVWAEQTFVPVASRPRRMSRYARLGGRDA